MLRLLVLCLCTLFAVATPAIDSSVVEKSVVRIFTQSNTGLSSGSGSVVAKGIVLTNHHVIEDANSVQVVSEHTDSELNAQVLWQSRELDLAILKVAGLNLPIITLTTAKPKKGEKVSAIGYPGASDRSHFNFDTTVTSGVISRFPYEAWHNGGGKLQMIQHDAAINPGNSGGPLFDECGSVLGVNTQKSSGGTQGVFWASRITEAISKLESKGITLQKTNTPCAINAGDIGEQVTQVQADQAQTKQIGQATLLAVVAVGILALFAAVMALRKPRQQIIATAERLSQVVRRVATPKSAKANRSHHIALTLAGFDTSGNTLRIAIPKQGTSAAQGGFVIGRAQQLADQAITDPSISRRHARITVEHQQHKIEDLNSTNGTRVNSQQIKPFTQTPLAPGDKVSLANIEMQVSSG